MHSELLVYTFFKEKRYYQTYTNIYQLKNKMKSYGKSNANEFCRENKEGLHDVVLHKLEKTKATKKGLYNTGTSTVSASPVPLCSVDTISRKDHLLCTCSLAIIYNNDTAPH